MYFLIYACFALYFNCIPPTQQFRIFGIRANDKLIPYILGVQVGVHCFALVWKCLFFA